MPTKFYHYTDQPGFTPDFVSVHQFLQRIYSPAPNGNWRWHRWQWMFSSTYLDESKLNRIGIWRDNGRVVALANYEHRLGEAYFSIDSGYGFLKKELLEYSMEYLCRETDHGKRSLRASVLSSDAEFAGIALSLGFTKSEDASSIAKMDISSALPISELPDGYSLLSLDQENNLREVLHVLHRGFDNPGPVPELDVAGMAKSQSGPNFSKKLSIAVKAPTGHWASYCSMWYDPATNYAIIEPLVTDPDYQLKGFGRLVVYEGVNRCFKLGARRVYVGSAQQFYYRIGFVPHSSNIWWQYQHE